MQRRVIFILFFWFILLSVSFAQTFIQAKVDKTILSVGDELVYKLTINSPEKQLLVPEFPDFKGFDVLSSAQTSEISVLKGNLAAFIVYLSSAFDVEIKPGQIKRFLPDKIDSLVSPDENEVFSESESSKITL